MSFLNVESPGRFFTTTGSDVWICNSYCESPSVHMICLWPPEREEMRVIVRGPDDKFILLSTDPPSAQEVK